jgi:Fe(3+) dicitrate transport protein
MVRTGLVYRKKDKVKVGLLGTFVDDHFADDGNAQNFFIPSYMVWDLTAEIKIYKDYASLLFGINNLFDEDYYSRIRADGIQPAYGRNFYVGFNFLF